MTDPAEGLEPPPLSGKQIQPPKPLERYDIPPCEEYPDDSGHNCIDNRVVYNFFCTPCRTRLAYDALTAQVEKLQGERDAARADYRRHRELTSCGMCAEGIDLATAEAALTTTREALENIAVIAVLNPPEVVPDLVIRACRRALSAIEENK